VRKTVTDRYIVKVPGDAGPTMTYLLGLAITEARERARLYCMPCEWTAQRLNGDLGDHEVTFKVTRRRNRKEVKA
jgi:hypothetical protein